MEKTIGIDLGTTFCAVATVDENGRPILLKNSEGRVLTPSVIYFEADRIVVGEEAKEMQGFGEENIASFFKRNMGDDNFNLNFYGQDYSAERLSAILLKKLRADAEKALNADIKKAVITVPAYFNNLQREATIRAAESIGLEVLRIINEPTAAAIAFGINQQNDQTILVYDLGGGTFDVTLLEIEKETLRVLGTDGDHELGGKNWDDRIVGFITKKFEEEFSQDPLEDSETLNDILVRAEGAKKQLSTRNTTRIVITHDGQKGRYQLDLATFEELTMDLLERTQSLTEQLLKELSFSWDSIDGVLLIGGSTKMPMVSKWIKQMSGKEPLIGINVDEAVAMGAAIQANIDANPKQLFRLGGQIKRIEDVMSHSLGLVAENQDRSKYINSIIITKNNQIPSIENRPYQIRTRQEGANELEVFMLQGESDRPLDCNIIGKYIFSNIQHEKSGVAVIDVEYAYDVNGVIKVSAMQRSIGRALDLKIEPIPTDMEWLDGNPQVQNGGSDTTHLSILIAIDLSGSMSGRPLKKAKKAALGFLQNLDLTKTSIGLMAFADTESVGLNLSQNGKKIKKGINKWQVGTVGIGNGTQPFTKAKEVLKDKEDPKFLIVLTDGIWYNQNYAVSAAETCKEAGIEIIAIGFGEADKAFLREIATSDENALLTNLDNLATSFSKIAQVLTETGNITTQSRKGNTNLQFFER